MAYYYSAVLTVLQRLNSIRQGELTWETKRQIVEALVADIEIEPVPSDPTRPDSRRVPLIHVRYAFDAPRYSGRPRADLRHLDAHRVNAHQVDIRDMDQHKTETHNTDAHQVLLKAHDGSAVLSPVPGISPAGNGVGVRVDIFLIQKEPACVRRFKSDAT